MADAGVLSRCLCNKKATAQLCGGFFVDGTLLWEWRARQQCGAACGSVKKLQIQFAGELVDDVVSCTLFGLDVHLAGLYADLVGGAVVCLGAVDDVGDVVLLTAHLYIQLRCQRRGAQAGGGAGGRGCKNHPKVLSRLSGIKASATVDDVRGMLLNPNMDIRIGSMPVNTAKLGKAAVKKGILGADVFIFHKSESPTTEDMSAVKTFTIDAPGVAEVHTLRDDLNHREFDEVLWSEDLRITAPIAIKRVSVS